MEYRNLSKFEKLAHIQQLNFSPCERHCAAIYLKALWINDINTLEDYEKFGHTARHILMNKRAYDRQLLFGFKEYDINEHGWITRPEFLEYEEVKFSLPKHNLGNGFQVGKGLNDKWTFGIDCSNNTSGHHSGVSIWGEIFSTRSEAVVYAIEYLILWHKKQNKDIGNKIIKLANEYLEKNINPIVVYQKQLQLF